MLSIAAPAGYACRAPPGLELPSSTCGETTLEFETLPPLSSETIFEPCIPRPPPPSDPEVWETEFLEALPPTPTETLVPRQTCGLQFCSPSGPDAAVSGSSADLIENTAAFNSSCAFCLGPVPSGLDRCRYCGLQGFWRKLHRLQAPCPSQVYRDGVPDDFDDFGLEWAATEGERLMEQVYQHIEEAEGSWVRISNIGAALGFSEVLGEALVERLEELGFVERDALGIKVQLVNMDEDEGDI